MTLTLKARKRASGQSSKQLRRSGQIPCSMYGKSVEAIQIQIPVQSLQKCLKEGVRKVNIDYEGQTWLASIEETQKEPVGNKVLHVSFHAFNQNDKVSLDISVHLKGKAKGQSEGGVLQQQSQTVCVYGPAKDLPEALWIEVGDLELGGAIHVSDLAKSSKYEIKESADKVLVACNYPKLRPIDDMKPEVQEMESPESNQSENIDKQAA